MKVKFLAFFFVIPALVLMGCNSPKPTANPPVILNFPTLSGETETAVFESTLWTPTSTGTITLIPTATDTLEPSNTPRPPSQTPIQPSQTATLQFSATPAQSFTPSVTPHRTKTASMTPTYAIFTKTPLAWGCTVQSSDPNGYKGFHPNDDFDAHFTVLNSGANDWTGAKESYRFINGTAMQTHGSSFAIPQYTQTNHSLSVTIDMKAPGTPGRYFSVWSFEHSQNTICLITISITVLNQERGGPFGRCLSTPDCALENRRQTGV